MLCRLCQGAGNFFVQQRGSGREWYVCPACGGAGVRMLYRPPTITIAKAQERFVRPETKNS